MKKIRIVAIVACVVALCVSASCRRSANADDTQDYGDYMEMPDTLTYHSRYLSISDHNDGTVTVNVSDPWNEGAYIGKYAFVDRDSAVPDYLGKDVEIIRTPIERAAVFSSVHISAFKELGILDKLVAVADGNFFSKNDTVQTLLSEGRIIDVGQSVQPSAERLAASSAEIVLRSPMQNDVVKLAPGIADIKCIDYMETSPMGRAEWLLLIGAMTGKINQAKDIFSQVIDEYSRLVFKVGASSLHNPKVLSETEQSGIWYVPAGQSYMARMFADAGALYPWADTDGSGSLPLSFENVAIKALDADIWLIRSYGYEADSKSLLLANPKYGSFKALKEGAIYSCDTSVSSIFDDIAFHPESILADYVAIFHPDVMTGYELRYFKRHN